MNSENVTYALWNFFKSIIILMYRVIFVLKSFFVGAYFSDLIRFLGNHMIIFYYCWKV